MGLEKSNVPRITMTGRKYCNQGLLVVNCDAVGTPNSSPNRARLRSRARITETAITAIPTKNPRKETNFDNPFEMRPMSGVRAANPPAISI